MINRANQLTKEFEVERVRNADLEF